MPQSSPALHMAIVVVDVADFTNPARTEAHQLAMHEGLYEVLRAAFAESGIDWASCETEDRGDGAMILVPAGVPKSLLADRLPDRLVAGLRHYNALHSVEAAVQLRVGLHFGEVRRNAQGVVGKAVNFAFRILDAAEAKSALRESPGVVALIASNDFYDDVIVQDPAAEPEAYRKIPVKIKHTSTEAWLRLPDGGPSEPEIPEKPEDAIAEPEPTQEKVLDLLTEAELERLSGWIRDITIDNPATMVRRAAGPAAPVPRTNNAWDVFLELTDVNAGPDGIPPAIRFLDLLAIQVAEELKSELKEWITRHVRRLRVESALDAWRNASSRIPAEPRLHLLIALEPDVPGGNRYQLSFWRQDDPDEWPPERGDIRVVDLDELEQRVDEVVLAAEEAWAGHSARVTLEFLLPRALLRLPVHRWTKELDSGNPRPLCIDYPIVLRSLDRMKNRYWHRVWHARWNTLLEDPTARRIHFGAPADTEAPHRVDALLSDPRWVSMVLTEAPPPEPRPGPGRDELTAALRSGLPILFWHPEGAPEAVREIVAQLAKDDGMSDLPARFQDSRRAEFLSSSAPSNINIARDLVVLWDDPTRIVALYQPPIPSQR